MAPRVSSCTGPVGPWRLRTRQQTYADVTYDGLVVELDGLVAHPEEARARDRRRDNAVMESGARTVRYGWADVLATPCSVAAQVARLLQPAGWTGHPRRCGRAGCVIVETQSAGINRHEEGDGNALHRRSSDPRWPRVMRWRP